MTDFQAERILLVARTAPLVRAWNDAFGRIDRVEPTQGDFFAQRADAMVSPANSFGIMDGGLDAAILENLGPRTQPAVQKVIVEQYHGEMPVGAAEIVPTGHAAWPFLVVTPTMRVPERVARTLNAYLAFRACLLAVARHNEAAARTGGASISTLLVPGLCTGVGGMEPRRCAAQMKVAFDQATRTARIPSFEEIHKVHKALSSA